MRSASSRPVRMPCSRRSVVDRDASWALQRAALELVWAARSGDEEPRARAGSGTEHGDALEGWARFCALAEQHGPSWRTWPGELRHPGSAAVRRAVGALADRVAFHAWLQLLVDEQLDAARAVGRRAWCRTSPSGSTPAAPTRGCGRTCSPTGFSIGAPPDDFQPDGQTWGLPPWVPWRLRDVGYRPLAGLLRAALVPGGGLRIDHAMGLTRLFWVPEDGEPADGAYVRFHGRELLELVALESARAGAVVVGEDLGTVEPGFRDELAARGSSPRGWCGSSTLRRRSGPSRRWRWSPPTTSPRWPGSPPVPTALPRCARTSSGWSGRSPTARCADVAVEVHRHLGRSPAMLAIATLEDVLGVAARPNQPGTTTERPNWSVALPVLVDDLPADHAAGRILDALADGRAD